MKKKYKAYQFHVDYDDGLYINGDFEICGEIVTFWLGQVGGERKRNFTSIRVPGLNIKDKNEKTTKG
ncbi:MAG: hypothetical protein DRP09_10980 [Candidatus Thorarchaeota archaeon]|nr:MAG: hypothetical protein DRP09_10980 [Candidatus Thorarchaeota archaeon]